MRPGDIYSDRVLRNCHPREDMSEDEQARVLREIKELQERRRLHPQEFRAEPCDVHRHNYIDKEAARAAATTQRRRVERMLKRAGVAQMSGGAS